MRVPNSLGIRPVNWLLSSHNHHRVVERLPNSLGIVPVSWLSLRSKPCSLVRVPNSLGIRPVSWLVWRFKCSSLERVPNSLGIVPVNWLLWRTNERNSERVPNSLGIWPVSWLRSRNNLVSLVRVPNSLGIRPDRRTDCRFLKSNTVTRELETVTPSQAVMVKAGLQFREAVPRRVSLRPRSVSQSAIRLACSGSGTATLLAHEMLTCAATGTGVVLISSISKPLITIIPRRAMRIGRMAL